MGLKLFMAVMLPLLSIYGEVPQVRLVIGDHEPSVVERVYERSLEAGEGWLSLSPLPHQVKIESVTLREVADTPRIEVRSQVLERTPHATGGGITQSAYQPRWLLYAAEADVYTLNLRYLVQGLHWRGVYHVLLTPDMDAADIQASVLIHNHTEEHHLRPDIVLKQMTGGPSMLRTITAAHLAGLDPLTALSEPPFPGIYPLPEQEFGDLEPFSSRTITLRDIPAKPVRPFLQYSDGMGGQDGLRHTYNRVWWRLELQNAAENGLGIPLPQGTVQVFQELADGIIFLSDMDIPPAPVGALLSLNLRNEPRVSVDREQEALGQSVPAIKNVQPRARHTVRISNELEDAREMRLFLQPTGVRRGSPATVTDASDLYKTHDDGQIEFRIELEPGVERIITFETER